MSKINHLMVIIFLLNITALSGIILTSPSTTAGNNIIDDVNVTIDISCTMSGTGMNSHNADVTNGTYRTDIGTTTLKAFCNDNEGFSIYAIGYTGDQYTGEDHTKLIGSDNSSQKIMTGTADSGATSNWAMKLNAVTNPTPTYPITLDNGYSNYNSVPDTYTKVAHRDSGTDVGANATGSQLTTTYAAYISRAQAADTYSGKVKYTLVHPKIEVPLGPQPTTPGYINYYANAGSAEGTMGRQQAVDGQTVDLFPSNFNREGYGIAGWSDAYDYATNSDAHFYGPNEELVVPEGTSTNGLALYAVWVKSEGNLQDTAKVSELCGTGAGSLEMVTYAEDPGDETSYTIGADLSNISALTDIRDGETYAIAKLPDGKCWMLENLRLADTHQVGADTVRTILNTSNTNNPLNNGTSVTLKHDYSSFSTFNYLAQPSNAESSQYSWCTDRTEECVDQSRIHAENTINRLVYDTTDEMQTGWYAYDYSLGNYYNWYSATAGRGYNDKGNQSGDICPFGWRLPVSSNNGSSAGNRGDFPNLSNSLGGYNIDGSARIMDSSTTPTGATMISKFKKFPFNYVLSGFIYGGDNGWQYMFGEYWTSYGDYTYGHYAHTFDLRQDSIAPGNAGTDKHNGESVRCLTDTQ